MEIKKAQIEDINRIMTIIKDAIIDMESESIFQWDNIYPDINIIKNDIYDGNLYVYIDENIIKGFITLNEFQDKEYKLIKWEYNTGKILVIHRLCIDPEYKNNGLASALIKFAESFAENNNYESIRLDSFTQNKHSCKLYEMNGYYKRGTVTFRKGNFYCFEKKI